MGERLSKFLPLFVGIIVPLLIILANSLYLGNILITIAAILWIGFAVVFLAPSGTTA